PCIQRSESKIPIMILKVRVVFIVRYCRSDKVSSSIRIALWSAENLSAASLIGTFPLSRLTFAQSANSRHGARPNPERKKRTEKENRRHNRHRPAHRHRKTTACDCTRKQGRGKGIRNLKPR